MRILVTGGCGYTGTILAINELWLKDNHEVIVIDTQWFVVIFKKKMKT